MQIAIDGKTIGSAYSVRLSGTNETPLDETDLNSGSRVLDREAA